MAEIREIKPEDLVIPEELLEEIKEFESEEQPKEIEKITPEEQAVKIARFGMWFNQINNDMASNATGRNLFSIEKFISTFRKAYHLYKEEYKRLKKIDGLGDDFYVQTYDYSPKRIHLVGNNPNSLFGRFREIVIYYNKSKLTITGLPHDDTEKVEELDIDPDVLRENLNFYSKHAEFINLLNLLYKGKKITDHDSFFTMWYYVAMDRCFPVDGKKLSYNYEFWNGPSGRLSFCLCNKEGKFQSEINGIEAIKVVLESPSGSEPYHYMEIYVDINSGAIDYSKCNCFINGVRTPIDNSFYDSTLKNLGLKKKTTVLRDFSNADFNHYIENLVYDKAVYDKYLKNLATCWEILKNFQEGSSQIKTDDSNVPRVSLKDYVAYFYTAYKTFCAEIEEAIKDKLGEYKITWRNEAYFEQEGKRRKLTLVMRDEELIKEATVVDPLTGTPWGVPGDKHRWHDEIVIDERGKHIKAQMVKHYKKDAFKSDYFNVDETVPTSIKANPKLLRKYLDCFKNYNKWGIIIRKAQGECCNELWGPHWGYGGKHGFRVEFFPDGVEEFGSLTGLRVRIHDCNYPLYHTYVALKFDFKNGLNIDYSKSRITLTTSDSEYRYTSLDDKELIDFAINNIIVPVEPYHEVGKIVSEQYVKTMKEGNPQG